MKFIAIIERAQEENGVYSARIEGILGAYGFGDTEEEALEFLTDVLHDQAEFHKGNLGYFPEWYKEGEKIKYSRRYDIGHFFERFPYFSVKGLSHILGVNRVLLGRYKDRKNYPTEKQRDKMQARLSKELAAMSACHL